MKRLLTTAARVPFGSWRLALALTFACSGTVAAADGFVAASDPAAIVRELGHGMNLSNALEAPREGQWGVTLQDDYFAAIAKAGFTTVRVPMRWSAHAAMDAPYAIEPAFWTRIDWVVAEAKTHKLHVILDFQNYDELHSYPEKNEDRFVGIWREVAEHYRNAPPSVLFELLNEPHDHLDAAKWNGLIVRALAVIRPTNPNRLVVVGPVSWNKVSSLPQLVLPAGDRFLVPTVHYYDPMTFTHQGAPWEKTSQTWLGNQWLGTAAEKQVVDHDFDAAVAWASAHHRPMFLGEFGTFEKADMASRQRWTDYVARSAEAHGMAWAYWEFCASFGAYDPLFQQWRAPLLEALIPK